MIGDIEQFQQRDNGRSQNETGLKMTNEDITSFKIQEKNEILRDAYRDGHKDRPRALKPPDTCVLPEKG